MLDRTRIFELFNATQIAEAAIRLACNNDLNSVDQGGLTALHWAVKCDRTDVAAILLEQQEINVNIQDQGGATPLHLAIRLSRSQLIPLLVPKAEQLQDQEGHYPLHECMLANDVATATLLLEQGADPNMRHKDDQSPLHFAFTASFHPAINRSIFVNLFLQYGAYYPIQNLQDAEHLRSMILQNENVLHILVRTMVDRADTTSLLYLLKAGILTVTEGENALLWLATQRGKEDVIAWLVTQGYVTREAIQQQKKNRGTSVLLCAAYNGQTAFVQWLLDQKYLTAEEMRTQKNDSGGTALLRAASQGQHKFVKWLLEKNYASIFNKDNKNNNILQYNNDKINLLVKEKIICVLEKQEFKSSTEEEDFINQCQKEFSILCSDSQFDQYKINHYARFGQYEQAYDVCFSILEDNTASLDRKDNARINIAEMIFLDHI